MFLDEHFRFFLRSGRILVDTVSRRSAWDSFRRFDRIGLIFEMFPKCVGILEIPRCFARILARIVRALFSFQDFLRESIEPGIYGTFSLSIRDRLARRGERRRNETREGETRQALNNRNAPRCSYYDFSKSGSARTEFNEHKLIQLVSGCPASLLVSMCALPLSMDLYETNWSSRCTRKAPCTLTIEFPRIIPILSADTHPRRFTVFLFVSF